MNLKKIVISLGILTASLMLVACDMNMSFFPVAPAKDYDFVIFDQDRVATFKEEDGQLIPVDNRKVIKGKGQIENIDFFEGQGLVYGKILMPGIQKFRQFRFNKETLQMEKQTITEGSDIFTGEFDGKYFYASAVFNDRLELYKYDTDFNLVLEKHLGWEEWGQLMSHDMLFIGDKLYMSVGIEKISDIEKYLDDPKNYATYTAELWIMNKDFEVKDRITLDYGNPDEHSNNWFMTLMDDTLFFSERSRWEFADTDGTEGKAIVTYSLKDKTIDTIPLQRTGPVQLYADSKRHVLQVQHDQASVDDYTWSLINTQTSEQRLLEFNRKEFESIFEPFSTHHNGNYYYLFDKKLVRYNYDTKEQIVYDLSEYGIKSADVIMFKDDISKG